MIQVLENDQMYTVDYTILENGVEVGREPRKFTVNTLMVEGEAVAVSTALIKNGTTTVCWVNPDGTLTSDNKTAWAISLAQKVSNGEMTIDEAVIYIYNELQDSRYFTVDFENFYRTMGRDVVLPASGTGMSVRVTEDGRYKIIDLIDVEGNVKHVTQTGCLVDRGCVVVHDTGKVSFFATQQLAMNARKGDPCSVVLSVR